MATYFTSSGLQRLAQSESGGRASLVHYPSGYTSSGTKSSASGLYGFLDSTWRQQAPQAGVDTSIYPRAYLAPADVQTRVASLTPTSHWTCEGCNSTANRLATNPDYVTGAPGAGGGPSGGGGAGDSGGYVTTDDPAWSGGPGSGAQNPSISSGTSFDPGAPIPTDPGSADYGGGGELGLPAGTGDLVGGLAGAAAGLLGGGSKGSGIDPTALPRIGGFGVDWLVRLALILLGAALVVVAAWALLKGETSGGRPAHA